MATVIEIELPAMIFHATHGVFEQEKIVGNEYHVSLLVAFATDDDGIIPDDLNGTISYAELHALAKECMERHSDLLENVASRIGVAIRQRYPQVCHLKVRVQKAAPPIRGMQGPAAVTYDWTSQ